VGDIYRLSGTRQAERRQRAAQSQYGQLSLTVTFEKGGRVSYRAKAKRPQDQWSEQSVFAQGSELFQQYPPTFDDAVAYFAMIAEGLRWAPPEIT
jgi:hypothetical protein